MIGAGSRNRVNRAVVERVVLNVSAEARVRM